MKFIDKVEEICLKYIEDLKGRWAFRQHQAYLKRMRWTEEAYQKNIDPLHNYRADRVSYFYHGYKHTHIFETVFAEPFIRYEDWTEAYQEMNEWCKTNCQGQWREDMHRVIKQHGLKQVGDNMEWVAEPEWFINDLAGGDALVYAFEDSKDYTMFLLRWS